MPRPHRTASTAAPEVAEIVPATDVEGAVERDVEPGEDAPRSARPARAQPSPAATPAVDVPDPDTDPDAEAPGETAADLVARELGAVVVERVSDG